MNQPHLVRNTGIPFMVHGLTTYPPVILHSYGRSTSFSSMIFPPMSHILWIFTFFPLNLPIFSYNFSSVFPCFSYDFPSETSMFGFPEAWRTRASMQLAALVMCFLAFLGTSLLEENRGKTQENHLKIWETHTINAGFYGKII